jgi:hypothetical protein
VTEYLGVVLALVVSRILSALIGLTFAYFGYKLFSLGVYTKAGELRAVWGERHLMLKQAAPGTFFALFGTVVTAVALLGGGDVERARKLTTTGSVNDAKKNETDTPPKPESPQPRGTSEELRRPRPEKKPIAPQAIITQEDRITTHLNHPPTMGCQADPSVVREGSGDLVNIDANASDPDGHPLTYSWQASAGTIRGTGPTIQWDSKGLRPGTYTVNVTVDDGHGGETSCSSRIRVEPAK